MTLAEWLFAPLPHGLLIAAVLRVLVGFSALALSERYRRDGNPHTAALALTLAGWTLAGGLAAQGTSQAAITPYGLGWLLLVYGLFVSIVLRRARRERRREASRD